MRTTLTLDDDVAAALERLRSTRRQSLKELVNEALRAGVQLMTRRTRKTTRPFRTASKDLGPCLVGNVDNVADVLSLAEGDTYR
ncbi:MAG: CopG family transcriptional regulator [Gemmatimonadaceae bacterium]